MHKLSMCTVKRESMSAKAQKMYQFLDGSASNSDPNESSGMVTALSANQEPVNVPRPEKEESVMLKELVTLMCTWIKILKIFLMIYLNYSS